MIGVVAVKEAGIKQRENVIIRTSVIGIAANIILAGFKALVGALSNSIAVILDAVNNLSDALSSIVTIVGTKLAGRSPDKKHPYGHGRIEYMSQSIVAAIILYAGITAGIESVKKLLAPEEHHYTTATVIVIASAVAVKILLGMYVSKKGKEVHSGSLTASGKDALFDAILSGSVLLSTILYLWTGIDLEAWVGILIAVFVVKSGLEMFSEAVDEILGMRAGGDLAKGIRHTIEKEPEVRGAYDLLLHNYGPDRYLGSVHIEVEDTLTADKIDELTRRIQDSVIREHGVIMTAVGIYSVNTKDEEITKLRNSVREIVDAHPEVLQFHGFYVDISQKKMSFDVIIDFDCDRNEVYAQIQSEVAERLPDYEARITLDSDMADL